MILLRNIEQIGEKFNCLIKDGSVGLTDTAHFINDKLSDDELKDLSLSLGDLGNKQNIIEELCEMIFQLRDTLPSLGNLTNVFLISKNYDQIVYFVRKIFVNQIGSIRYQSNNGTYSFVERYFDRFIEIVRNCKVKAELYIPFIAKIVASNEDSVLYQWKRPAEEYIQLFFNQNQDWILTYIKENTEYKYDLIEAICEFNTAKGIALLIQDFTEKLDFDEKKCKNIIKKFSKDVITYIDKEFISANENQKLCYIQIYEIFVPDGEIVTRLRQIYENDKSDLVKTTIANILGITETLSIKTEKQFLYTVRRKIKEPQQRALGFVFDKVNMNLKSGFKCDDAVFTFIIFLFKEEKNLNNIKKLKVLENIIEKSGLQSFAEGVYDEIKDKQDILCAKWALRFCSLFGSEDKVSQMCDLVVKLFKDGRKKEANYLTLCLIHSGRDQVLLAIKELNQNNPELISDLKDDYALQFAKSNNRNIDDVYDELVEDVITDQSVSDQTKRLFDAFISNKEYSPKKFDSLFMENGVLGTLATKLVWGEYKFNRLYNCFIIDNNEKKYIVKTLDIDDYKISIVHSLDLDERFDNVIYAINNPLFEQFRRSVFDINDYSKMAVSITRFEGMFINVEPFIKSMKEFGFVYNKNDEDVLIPSLVYVQKDLGILVEVNFDKPVSIDQQFATLSDIYFYKLADIIKNGNKYNTLKTNAISVGGVGYRLFDFILNSVSVSSRKK